MVYDINGVEIANLNNEFAEIINYEYKRDETTGIFYTMINIPQTSLSGKKQYPFVYYPNYPNGGIESTFQMNQREKFLVAINAGRFASPFGPGVTITGVPMGTVIQNSENYSLIENGREWDRVLTINDNGELNYAELNEAPQSLIARGIVSATTGFIPLIINFKNAEDVDDSIVVNAGDIAQRLAICQYNNGDYLIVGVEARGNQSTTGSTSEGMNLAQLQTICRNLGVKFAFALDGGGSMELVVGQRQLNPFYDDTYGRKVPVYIVFNGTTSFDPSA